MTPVPHWAVLPPPFPSFFTPIFFNPTPFLPPKNSNNPLRGAGTRADLNPQREEKKSQTKNLNGIFIFFLFCFFVCVFSSVVLSFIFIVVVVVSNPTTGALRSVFWIFFSCFLFEMHVAVALEGEVGARGGFIIIFLIFFG